MYNPFLEKKWEFAIISLSAVIQILFGYFLGHYYDIRIFMATGYAVNSGLNPYLYHDLGSIFSDPLLIGNVPGIGYPPPWPLMLGIIYRLSFYVSNNIFIYNLAIKIPIIIGNILLANVVKHILIKMKVSKNIIRNSWLFLLLNPFLILTTSAWGQFDTIVALFFLMSLYFLYINRRIESAITLALSVSLKPVTLPLVLIPAFYLVKTKLHKKLEYYSIFTIIVLLFSAFPFFLFQWNTQTLIVNWNAHFRVAGAMSPFNLIELFEGSFLLPGSLEFLGLIWLPAVVIAYYVLYRNPPKDFEGLIKSALFLIFVFFLTRTWLSEQNINLILPLFVIIVAKSKILSSKILHAIWIVPLVFMFFNTSFHQLFFLVDSDILFKIAVFDENYQTIRLILRFFIVVIWQFLGWNIVTKLKWSHIRNKQNNQKGT